MRRSIADSVVAVLLLALPASPALGQAEKTLQFDVVSVRQNKSSDRPSSNFSLDSGNSFSVVEKGDISGPGAGIFSATGQPLLNYINFAYKLTGTEYLALRFKEFIGPAANIPAWVGQERFDIQARVEGNPTKDMMRLMMQQVLADRFKLVVHQEVRQVPVFGLVLAKRGKTGPALHPHPASDSCVEGEAPPGLPPVCGVIVRMPPGTASQMRIGARQVPLTLLASSLPTQTGMMTLPRPVIDETGLDGLYDFALEWAPDLQGANPSDAAGPSFQEALRQQLGLRLVLDKGAVQVLVIDHVEQPTAN